MNEGSSKQKILLVEDDVNLGFLLVDYLESNGFEVKLYTDGVAGLRGFQLSHYDLCIIDIMLPKMDGFSLIGKIRETGSSTPIIILSARSMRDDKLRGFQIGVDDYITKPFDEEELLYRVKAILARIRKPDNLNPEPTDATYTLGKYQFDCLNQRLILNDTTNRLTVKESAILRILCSARNKLVRREELMLEVWGESNYFTGRSLDVFISKLRKYLKNDPGIQITSIPTVGYILEVRE